MILFLLLFVIADAIIFEQVLELEVNEIYIGLMLYIKMFSI